MRSSRDTPTVTATTGGTYTILVAVPDATTLEVGALGRIEFEAGWYAYTGSAFGPGGLGRVDRHRTLAAGDRETRHWHVDYLLGGPAVDLDGTVCSPAVDVECPVASAIDVADVPEFGCSDCDCHSHLAHASRRRPLFRSVTRAHRRARTAAAERAETGDTET
jgi:endonuclease-3